MSLKSTSKKSVIYITITALSAGFFASPVAAQSDPLKDAKTQALESVEALLPLATSTQATSTPSLSPQLKARQAAFVKVLEYSYAESEELMAKMTVLASSTEPAVAALARVYIDGLTAYQKHLSLLTKHSTEDVLTSPELKLMAVEFKAYRADVIDVMIRELLDFDLWTQADEALSTILLLSATIAVDIDTLVKDGILNKTYFDQHLDTVHQLLADAQVKHARAAEVVFAQVIDLVPTSTLKLAATGRSDADIALATSEPIIVRDALKDVYEAVAEAYRQLIVIRARLVK